MLAGRFLKKADPQPPVVVPQLNATEASKAVQRSALKDLLAVTLLTGALGIGARTLAGSKYVFGDSSLHDSDLNTGSLPNKLVIPKPVFTDEKTYEATHPELEPKKKLKKKAQMGVDALTTGASQGAVESGVQAGNAPALYSTKDEIPWYYGGMLLASLLGGVGGYRLTDKILDNKRKKDIEDEVAEAKRQFQQSLVSNYRPDQIELEKKATEDQPSLDYFGTLDRFTTFCGIEDGSDSEKAIKQASVWSTLLNYYGLAAIPLALAAGVATYKATRSRSTDALLEKSLKRRRRELMAKRPMDLQVVPEPVKIQRGKLKVEESEEPV